jgi:NAD(P)-dependent dehydrogenase (short-subunit alcohol dehydrogenase family)
MEQMVVVLITGASSGFGRLITETLARKNYQVFATMRNVNSSNAAAAREIQELAKRESLSLSVLELDVTNDSSVERAVDAVVAGAHRIDVLVNNAGHGVMDLAETVTNEVQAQLLEAFGITALARFKTPSGGAP